MHVKYSGVDGGRGEPYKGGEKAIYYLAKD